MLEAVETIHDNKICHRDLKPDNILLKDVDDETFLTLIDFGIGVDFEDGRPIRGHNGAQIWSAPETQKFKDYDEKCDIYSVGCLLTYMLTGKYPPS